MGGEGGEEGKGGERGEHGVIFSLTPVIRARCQGVIVATG